MSGSKKVDKSAGYYCKSQGREITKQLVEHVLRAALLSGMMAAALVIPNAPIALEKPVNHILKRLDKRQKDRELRRIVGLLKRQKLVLGSYENGLEITSKGKKRLEKIEFETLKITKPEKWDHKWRLVIFDVPHDYDQARRDLILKLKNLDFQLLQLSVWVHPYPCRDEVTLVCERYEISKFVTIIETSHIDHEEKLIKRFNHLFKS